MHAAGIIADCGLQITDLGKCRENACWRFLLGVQSAIRNLQSAIAACTALLLLATVASAAPPAAIETESVPDVPAELEARLEQYQNMRAAGFAGWQPQGRGMLVRTRFGNSVQLHRVYEPGGRREQITFYDEPVSGGFLPEQTDEAILLSMSRGGDENTQISLLDRQQFRTTLLTDGSSRNSLGPAKRDGSQIVIGSNKRNGRDTDLYVADPRRADSMQMLMEVSGQFWSAVDWSADGKTLLLNRYVSATESHPALFDIPTSTRTELPTPNDQTASFGPMGFSADGKWLYIASDSTGEFTRLARLPVGGDKYEWLTDDIDWDVAELAIDPHSPQFAATINADGVSRLLLWDDRGRELQRRELKLPIGIASSLEFSPDGKRLGFTFARPDAPADAYALDLASGELTRWTFSEVGGLDPASFVVPERVSFSSFDKRTISAWCYRPRKPKLAKPSPSPVLILVHGGPESQFQPYFSSGIQYYVNEMGLAVIAPNVRGSSGYGKTFLKLDDAAKREESVKDIGTLLDWIVAQPDLDASRVAISGGSYGGYMTLASLVHYGDRLKAGIDNVGIANFVTFLEATAAYRQDLRRVEYGDERDPEMRKLLTAISPTTNADKIRSALLVAHGKNDPRVPFAEAQQIAERVRANGLPVWTVYASNEGHGFSKKDNADYLRAVEVMFLRESLKLDEQ